MSFQLFSEIELNGSLTPPRGDPWTDQWLSLGGFIFPPMIILFENTVLRLFDFSFILLNLCLEI